MTTDGTTPRPGPQDASGGRDLGDLRDLLAGALAEAAGIDPTQDSGTTTLVRLVGVAARAEGEVRSLTREAVVSARSAGASWDAIGRVLGMTRQAAQQRFGSASASASATAHAPAGPSAPTPGARERPLLAPERRRLAPLDATTEMAALEEAGRQGWRSVTFGAGFHEVERTTTQWEHTRIGVLPGLRSRLERQGYTYLGTWFPWAYFARDLGTPAVDAPTPDPLAPLWNDHRRDR